LTLFSNIELNLNLHLIWFELILYLVWFELNLNSPSKMLHSF
jgi:hypothetical protein